MVRNILSVVVVACLGLTFVGQARAERPYPRRYERGSYVQYVVKKRQGKPVISQVYNGYSSRFPPPAFLYYGYPHSGDETGIGPLDRK